jgi:hypothetical protein
MYIYIWIYVYLYICNIHIGSVINLQFQSVQGVTFFLFKNKKAITQFESKNQADYMVMRYVYIYIYIYIYIYVYIYVYIYRLSENDRREEVNLVISSADTYYFVFDNKFGDFYSHIEFKLTLQLTEYTYDINTVYTEIYPVNYIPIDKYILNLKPFTQGKFCFLPFFTII